MAKYVRLRICLITVVVITGSCSTKHPSDKDLLENFNKYRNELNQLAQMFLADRGLTRVAYDFTRPNNPETIGVTKDRIKQYRSLFSKLDLSAGIDAGVDSPEKKKIIWFLSSTKGLSVSGSTKGYAYSVKSPELIVENLDTYWSKDGRSFTAYKHIEGNWYVYFDFED